ncbi:MAG: hypothetical protein AAB583_00945, partial [Patescibacteria group bacterium]
MKILKLLFVPIFLVALHFSFISYPYFFSKINEFDSFGFLSLVEERSVNIQKTFSQERSTDQFDNHLLKGEKVKARIRATENNFGILLFRFAKLSSIVSDTVIFRIKREGEGKWYYENTYKADQFQPDQYFSFGFPSIANSKNKTYVFEIESQEGTYKNGVGVSLDEPQVALVYKYARDDLLNLDTLSSFIFKKSIYVVRSVNFLQNWQLFFTFVLSIFFVLLIQKKKIKFSSIVISLPKLKETKTRIFKAITERITYLSKKSIHWFTFTNFYLLFVNTNTKKRLTIGLLIFLLALTYRFSSSLVNQQLLFYAGLGGQGDYDQFIRAATCALRSFCPAILGQNFLFESSILGLFYEIFGFTGGLKAYLYLMIILSSIVAPLPYVLLSRKNWITIGGAIGSFFLATSDFLTEVALNFPPDNSSLFTFSIFFIVYFLTLHIGTIRWLLLFGLVGTIDGLNKALFLINDLVAFLLFIPIFLFEKAKRINNFPSIKLNSGILVYSAFPLLIFLVIYFAWEYFVYIKFYAHYFLGRLIVNKGDFYISFTTFNSIPQGGNIFLSVFYICASAVVMLKRVVEFGQFNIFFLVAISIGLVFLKFQEPKVISRKFIMIFFFPIVTIFLLFLMKNNYYNVHGVLGDHMYAWTNIMYINIFLFTLILYMFILNFKYKAIRLSLPIIPYIIMLIILTKNSPF